MKNVFYSFLIFTTLSFAEIDITDTIYTSQNLAGHTIFAECNPGGGTNCPCSALDASITSLVDYGSVTSNIRQVNTFVNAIGYKKFPEIFPDGDSISLGIYKYVGYIKLPIMPLANYSQHQNPQGVHFMIQVWDGRGKLFGLTDSSYECSIYWELNPWVQPSGKVYIYKTDTSNPSGYILIETGIILSPDTLWHRFELVSDLVHRKYVSVTVDGNIKAMDYPMHHVYHPDWGQDISLIITTETSATWPEYNCNKIFYWSTYFKDLVFTREQVSTEVSTNDLNPLELTLAQNYPNPFNPSTTISYQLPVSSDVVIKVYDVLGNEVATLVNEYKTAGNYEVEFNEVGLPSGVYFYQLKTENFVETKKMISMK